VEDGDLFGCFDFLLLLISSVWPSLGHPLHTSEPSAAFEAISRVVLMQNWRMTRKGNWSSAHLAGSVESRTASCTAPRPSPLPGAVTGSKTPPPLPEKRTKTKRLNPSPTNLRPPGPRAKARSSAPARITLLLTIMENTRFWPRIGQVGRMVSAPIRPMQCLFTAFGTAVLIGGFATIVLLCSCSTATHSFERPDDVTLEKWVGRGMILSAKVRTEDGNEFWCAIDTGSEITSVPVSLETRLGKRLGSGMMSTLGIAAGFTR